MVKRLSKKETVQNVLGVLTSRGGYGSFGEILAGMKEGGFRHHAAQISEALHFLQLELQVGHIGREYFVISEDYPRRAGELLVTIQANLGLLEGEQKATATALLFSGLSRTANTIRGYLSSGEAEGGKEAEAGI